MAKDKAKTKEDKAKEKPAKAEAPKHKYGVADLAKRLNIKDASVRVQLRNHNVKKSGKSYGWDTKEELDAVVAKLKPNGEKSADKPKGKSKD